MSVSVCVCVCVGGGGGAVEWRSISPTALQAGGLLLLDCVCVEILTPVIGQYDSI